MSDSYRKEGRTAVGLHACLPTYRNLTTSIATRARMSASGVKRTLACTSFDSGLVVLDTPHRKHHRLDLLRHRRRWLRVRYPSRLYREHIMNTRKIPLNVVVAPASGAVLEAPPVLIASEHSVDFTCGRCGTVVLHADEGQVHGVLIRCKNCGSYNSTEA